MRLHSILTLVATFLLASATIATATAQTPDATPAGMVDGWRIADARQLDMDGEGLVLSPDGQWLAGVGPTPRPVSGMSRH